MSTVTIVARVRPELREALYAAADDRGQTVGGLIEDSVDAHLAASAEPLCIVPGPFGPATPSPPLAVENLPRRTATRTEIVISAAQMIKEMTGGDPDAYDDAMSYLCDGWRDLQAWEATRRLEALRRPASVIPMRRNSAARA